MTSLYFPEGHCERSWASEKDCHSYGRVNEATTLGIMELATYGSMQLGNGDDSSLKVMSDPSAVLRIILLTVT
jgi:hypothetical protein